MPTLSNEDYNIGWITALPVELTAAVAMLDEHHPTLSRVKGDDNTYVFGRIQGHNIVIACLPDGETGIASAAQVAVHMQ